MVREYEYFADFLARPSDYNNRVFHEYLVEWREYIKAHADEFNYLEDDEWKEIRERIIAEIEIRVEIREKFDEIEVVLKVQHRLPHRENLEIMRRLLNHVKTYEKYYEFEPECLPEFERELKNYEQLTARAEISQMNFRLADYEFKQALAALDEKISGFYQTTGKIPILTAIPHKKKPNGN